MDTGRWNGPQHGYGVYVKTEEEYAEQMRRRELLADLRAYGLRLDSPRDHTTSTLEKIKLLLAQERQRLTKENQ